MITYAIILTFLHVLGLIVSDNQDEKLSIVFNYSFFFPFIGRIFGWW